MPATYEQLWENCLKYLHRRAKEIGFVFDETNPKFSDEMAEVERLAYDTAVDGKGVANVIEYCDWLLTTEWPRLYPKPQNLQGFVHLPLTECELTEYMRLFNHPRAEDLEMCDVKYTVPKLTDTVVLNYTVDADDEDVLKWKPGTQIKLPFE